ncbi:MAG: hypothetical protein LBL72_11095 [Candidatus Accumulibacter sp.]|jgi:hypothetical protein|nr:hypothetical protein [Accumulibacter sp.]
MAKKYFLRFLLRGQSNDLIVPVRKGESTRLNKILSDTDKDSASVRFFWFETLKGRSFALNLGELQAVRFLWDPSELPPDETRDDRVIELRFRDRAKSVEAFTEAPDRLFDLFTDLEYGPDAVPYPKFEDEDGEIFQINPVELIWISAPTHLLREGERMVNEENGIGSDDV